jgi:N-acetyltransferase 10
VLILLFRLTLCILALTSEELSFLFTPFDLKRIESYAQNSLDYHVILDLLPTVAVLFFEGRLGDCVRLSAIQSSILLGIGLQRKTVEEAEVRLHPAACTIRAHGLTCFQVELHLPVSQALALFVKLIRKISGHLHEIQKTAIGVTIPERTAASSLETDATLPLVTGAERGLKTMEAELDAAGHEATAALREEQRAMIDSLDLLQ